MQDGRRACGVGQCPALGFAGCVVCRSAYVCMFVWADASHGRTAKIVHRRYREWALGLPYVRSTGKRSVRFTSTIGKSPFLARSAPLAVFVVRRM